MRSSWAHYCMQHGLIPRSHKVESGYITRKIFQYCKPGDVRTLKFLGLSVLTIKMFEIILSVLSLNVVWPILCLSYSSICLLFLTIIRQYWTRASLSLQPPLTQQMRHYSRRRSYNSLSPRGKHNTALLCKWPVWRPLFEIEESSANSVSLFELFITQLKAVVGLRKSLLSTKQSVFY